MSHRIPITLGPDQSYSMADPDHPLVTRALDRITAAAEAGCDVALPIAEALALRSLLADYRHLHTTAPTAQSAERKLRALRAALLARAPRYS